MIRITGLKKSYSRTQVLRNVNLALRAGVITGLVGPNACGKTTLIKSLLGLVIPDAGEMTVNNEPVNSSGDYRRHLGYMPQNPDFPGNLKVQELFSLFQELRRKDAPLLPSLVARFELQPFLKRPFGLLSGGTKQKVAAVSAFMFEPALLILDEPTVGLDPVAALHLKDLMREAAAAGKTILLVSHILSEVEQLVSDMIFLLDGEVQFSGSVEQLRQRTGCSSVEDGIVALLKTPVATP